MMRSTILRRLILTKEVYLAILTVLLGLWCLDQTRDLEGNAWTFPFFISLALVGLGIAQFVQAVADTSERTADSDVIHAILRGAGLIAVVAGVWIWALDTGLGYLVPSAIAAFAMLTVLQHGTVKQRIVHAVSITAVIFILFYLLFDSPLPVLEPVERFFDEIKQLIRD